MKKLLAGIVAAAVALCAAVLWAGDAKTPGRKGLPAKLVLGSLTDQYEPVPFDHAAHIGLAGGCSDCHHQHGAGDMQACGTCHALSAAEFKRTVNLSRIRPCRECHPAAYHPEKLDRPILKAAYHRACFKCHKDVGSVGKDPKGCTEICHDRKSSPKEGSADGSIQ